jgi:hypothetical protein
MSRSAYFDRKQSLKLGNRRLQTGREGRISGSGKERQQEWRAMSPARLKLILRVSLLQAADLARLTFHRHQRVRGA